eukprot:scaffold127545_cov60-Attheya_sp.AAC.1
MVTLPPKHVSSTPSAAVTALCAHTKRSRFSRQTLRETSCMRFDPSSKALPAKELTLSMRESVALFAIFFQAVPSPLSSFLFSPLSAML